MTTIEEKVIKTICYARKSLPFDKYGAELCKLVGLYLLDLLTKKFSKQNIGLYRDEVV